MDALALIAALTPGPPDWSVDWGRVEGSELALYSGELKNTPQDPLFHGEGDVWTHTKKTCEALAELKAFRAMDARGRAVLFTAALLHDVGKARVTRLEDGRLVSPNHSVVGEHMARQLLWTGLGLCGDRESQDFRESVCALVRRHSLPARVIYENDAIKRLRSVSQIGLLARGFTLRRLTALSEADVRGRVCRDLSELAEAVELCGELATQAGCLDAPYPFPDGHTRFSYLSGRQVAPDYPLYDDLWGPVIMVAGLPGTGKDTWIAKNCPGVPVVSLDAIRQELSISPVDNQGPVAEEARRRARGYLRERTPFVWNATDVTADMRRRPLELIHRYGAWTRIVYLETDLAENLRRNANRPARVPEDVIYSLLGKLSPPAPGEAREVDWVCV